MTAPHNTERSDRARVFNADAIYTASTLLAIAIAMLVARWMGVR